MGVDVVIQGHDQGQLAPMVEQVTERCGQSPEEWLVDGGYPAHEQLDAVAEQTEVYAPVPKAKDEATDPHAPKAGDSEAVAAWRQRMGTEEAKHIYKDRAATAECVNALARERGLTRLRVRGAKKVKCVLLRLTPACSDAALYAAASLATRSPLRRRSACQRSYCVC